MPIYEYECSSCGFKFERQQSMTDAPIRECPECKGEVKKIVSGGSGFIFKNSGQKNGHSCSLESTGRTCCGRENRCDSSPCGKN